MIELLVFSVHIFKPIIFRLLPLPINVRSVNLYPFCDTCPF